MSDNDQLLIPDLAREDPESFEILRLWVANEGQHISLRAGVWSDPAAWGIMLADLVRHIANSYGTKEGFDRAQILQRIKSTLDIELDSPTDHLSGEIHTTN